MPNADTNKLLTNSILLISYYAPSRGHAGSLRLLDLYRELRRLKPSLHISLIAIRRDELNSEMRELREIFDEIHLIPKKQFYKGHFQTLNLDCSTFDLIDLQFHQAGKLIKHCRRLWPKAVVTFSPMESKVRAASILSVHIEPHLIKRIKQKLMRLQLAFNEIRYIRMADRVTTVSEPDRMALLKYKTNNSIFCVPTRLSQLDYPQTASEIVHSDQQSIVFFAFFGSKTNREALSWYCHQVHPLIRKQHPSYVFRVIGRGLDTMLINSCTLPGIEFIGEVKSTEDGIAGATVAIAPALDGAGVRGKIHQYAMLSIPCVATSLACEGLDYKDGESIVVADSPQAFADACTNLLLNSGLRASIAENSKALCLRKYTWSSLTSKNLMAYNKG